jgi:hypothetical protein
MFIITAVPIYFRKEASPEIHSGTALTESRLKRRGIGVGAGQTGIRVNTGDTVKRKAGTARSI